MTALMERTDIADLLKKFRRRKGLSQAELAQKLGIPRSTYATYELNIELPVRVREELEKIGFGEEVGEPRRTGYMKTVFIPYIGSVAASSEVDWISPLESEQWEEVPYSMSGPDRFCCRVASDSCYDLLWPGDLAVFTYTEDIPVGKVVLYRSDDNLVTIKQIRKHGFEYILHPLNPKYEDMVVKGGRCLGFLVGLVRLHGTREATVYDVKGIDP